MNTLELKHFLITSAVAKHDTRKHLTYAYSDGENLAATNGTILVYFPTASMPDSLLAGYYEPVTTGTGSKKTVKLIEAECDSTFPNWKSIIPADAPMLEHSYSVDRASAEQEKFLLLSKLVKATAGGRFISDEYLAFLGKTRGAEWHVSLYMSGLLMFKYEDITMLLMPHPTAATSPLRTLFSQTPDLPNLSPTAPATVTVEVVETGTGNNSEPRQEAAPEAVEGETVEVGPKAPATAPKARKPATRSRTQYHCTLADGSHAILFSMSEVTRRGDVVECRIETPNRKRTA